MPCPSCKTTFKINPCESPHGIIKLDTLTNINGHITPVVTSFLKRSTLNTFLELIYLDLHSNCPCKLCLVKTMCSNGNACPEFEMVLNNRKEIANECYDTTIKTLMIDPNINEKMTKYVDGGKSYKVAPLEVQTLELTYNNVSVLMHLKGQRQI